MSVVNAPVIRKTATAAFAALALATAALAGIGDAEARPRYRGHHWGYGAGAVGALAVGGLLAAAANAHARPVYVEHYEPIRRCRLVARVNRFGDVIGHRRVCRFY